MIPFVDEITRECFSKSLFSLVDETLENPSLLDDFDPSDLLFAPEDFADLDCSVEDINFAVVGLNCFVSGCTEHCAKTHCTGLDLDLDLDFSDNGDTHFLDLKDIVVKEEPVEVEDERPKYTPHWDHCYFSTTAQEPEAARVKVEAFSSTDSEDESEDEKFEKPLPVQQQDNDDYFVDVESLPRMPQQPIRPLKRPVGRPRIHNRQPLDADRNRQVYRINKALKRSLPAPAKNPRSAKRKRNSVESTPSSSDTEEFRPYDNVYRNTLYRNPNPNALIQRRYQAKQAVQQAIKCSNNRARNIKVESASPQCNSPQKKRGRRTKGQGKGFGGNNLKHNNAEKERRNIQRVALIALKDLLPIDKPNAPKVVILNTAASVVTKLTHKNQKMERRKEKLLAQKRLLMERLRDMKSNFYH